MRHKIKSKVLESLTKSTYNRAIKRDTGKEIVDRFESTGNVADSRRSGLHSLVKRF